MDWAAGISILLAIAGFLGAAYSAYKNKPMSLWMPLAYFSLMGVLQAFSMQLANQCALPANQVATLLAYFHTCFQPFFLNAAALHFIDRNVTRKIDLPVYGLCFITAIMMLIRVYPFAWAGHCETGSIMCGEILCTMRDGWHMAWLVPINQVSDTVPWYLIAGIIVPVLYGSWRFIVFYLLACPLVAYLDTNDMNTWPALSCLLTIPFLLAICTCSNMRDLTLARRWWCWRYLQAGH